MAARGLGGLIGGLLIAQLGEKLSPAKLLAYGLATAGLFILLMVNIPSLAIILPLITLAGISSVAWLVSIQTLLQQNTEDAYRGRIFGAFSTTNMLLMLMGAIFGGALADQIGSTALMNGASLIYVLAGLLAFILLVSHIAQRQPLSRSAIDQEIS
jgi:MFS family permease